MKKTRLLAFLLTACLATTCFLSGTVAKYSTKEATTDEARVARWSFTVGTDNKDIAKAEDFTFDLFKTIANTPDGTTADANVDVDGKENNASVIAPGTGGSFTLILTNASEVDAEYKIEFNVENGNSIPVEFQVVKKGATLGTTWTSWSEFNSGSLDVYNKDDNTGVDLAFGADADEYTVYWRWVFESGADADAKKTNNAADTALGIATGETTLKVTATITAEQVD